MTLLLIIMYPLRKRTLKRKHNSEKKEEKNCQNRIRRYLHKYKQISKGDKNEELENGLVSDVISPQEEESSGKGEGKSNDYSSFT
ncbi:hypothetical protein AK88_03567 [Plasmodium fragile]|uniref:Uncharacterized protein n=1 Tax=Plasmodium fragile TaxID=5857 RepID=A0A0D9QIH5_PLAFR|nr:uncharacterized protein AK88_03567 [Plasmodium fragile]KJP86753.1 hypothetical protein AK88_03567 [Plasmodium fragile]